MASLVMPMTIYPPVRTFHARHGRMSEAKKAILRDVLPYYEVAAAEGPVDLRRRFPGLRTVIDFGAGMGAHSLELAAAGVGTLGLVEFDTVDLSNLQRQLIHGTPDVGRAKMDSAIDRLRAINPHVRPAEIEQAVVELLRHFPTEWPCESPGSRKLRSSAS